MKKLFSLIFTTIFVLSLSISPVFGAETDYERVLNDVNKTNAEIDKMISEAVKQSEEEINKYIVAVEIIEKGKDLVEVEKKISELRNNLNNLNVSDKDYLEKYIKIFKELMVKENQRLELIQRNEARVNELQRELDDMMKELNSSKLEEGSKKYIKIGKIINKLEEKIDRSNTKIAERTDKLNAKIDEIKTNLINDTNKKAAEVKKRAADKGFVAICEWSEVQIGGDTILVDPIRIVGY